MAITGLSLVWRRRVLRKRTLLIFITVVLLSVLYICYQAFSVGRLGDELNAEYLQRKALPRPRQQLYQKADDLFQRNELPNDVKVFDKPQSYSTAETAHGIRIKGVAPDNVRFYIPNIKGHFRCLDSTEEFKFSKVNDNYCDCEDGSDEPSTSACQNGHFYCQQLQRNRGLLPVFIPSSRVNDGICDCCDGSDEWQKVELPDSVKIPDSMELRLLVDQVPCRNRCLL